MTNAEDMKESGNDIDIFSGAEQAVILAQITSEFQS
jgi:hypothetical protein